MKTLSISETNPGLYLYSNKTADSDSVKKNNEITRDEIHKRTRAFKGVFIGSIIGISCWALVITSIVSIL